MSLEAILIANKLFDRVDERARKLRTAQRLGTRRQEATNEALSERIESLEGDLGYVTLVLAALMCRLDEQGVVTQDDVRSLVSELDGVDGVTDGKLDVNLLKDLTGE